MDTQISIRFEDFIEIIIHLISSKGKGTVIADFGCGEARLSSALSPDGFDVRSFDLHALNDRVTVCDMANVPMEDDP